MTTKRKIPFGWVQKAHGIKGELLIGSDSGHDLTVFPEQVFLSSRNSSEFAIYEVLKARSCAKGWIIQLKNCSDRTSAEKLKGCQLFLEQKELTSKKGDPIFLSELLGFSVVDAKDNNTIGKVSSFLSHSHQDLLVIQKSDEKEKEIPFVKEYIQKIDFDRKILYLLLPEGLLRIDEL